MKDHSLNEHRSLKKKIFTEQLFIITYHITKTVKKYVYYIEAEHLSKALCPQEFGLGNKTLHLLRKQILHPIKELKMSLLTYVVFL